MNFDIANVRTCGILEELFGLGKSINRLPKSCPPLMQCRQLCSSSSSSRWVAIKRAKISFLARPSVQQKSPFWEEAFLITFFFTKNALLCPTWSRIFYSFIHPTALSRVLWDKDKIYTTYLKTRYETWRIFYILI